MDDQKFGPALRAVRVKRGMTQREVARMAGASDASVSRLERGLIEPMSMAMIRAIARVLGVRVELQPRSRAAEMERIGGAAHAALAEAVVAWLRTLAGWVVRPEVGFSHYGERGVIDLAGWHAARGALLIIELKTELVDLNALLGTLDRYVRNAAVAAAPMGWRPGSVSRLLIVGDSDFNRHRVREHAALLGSALPDRGVGIRRWLADPAAELSGLMFFASRHPGSTSQRVTTVRRVRGRNRRHPARASHRLAHESAGMAAR